MPARIFLSPTSALVLLWDRNASYRSRLSRRYLSLLDLTAGKKLFAACHKIWPHYAENIRNRKYCIFELAKNALRREMQVVILGAGIAPLSRELQSHFTGTKIFDIDLSLMSVKKRLVEKVLPRQSAICFVTADASNLRQLSGNLSAAGWEKKKPSLVIIEGLSYYIFQKSLRGIFELFRSTNRQNQVIVEYLVPAEEILKERRRVPGQVIAAIAGECGDFQATRYSHRDLAGMAKTVERFRMNGMEKFRIGRNLYFPTGRSGWIETISKKGKLFFCEKPKLQISELMHFAF